MAYKLLERIAGYRSELWTNGYNMKHGILSSQKVLPYGYKTVFTFVM